VRDDQEPHVNLYVKDGQGGFIMFADSNRRPRAAGGRTRVTFAALLAYDINVILAKM
jgi:hypothetical protein